ncbi:MAG TPA: DUF2461 domain-containing protein [Saprospiraceae bacterium]|nr:DUF2461 domain-containing protein [Saprospiraceae bacterium]
MDNILQFLKNLRQNNNKDWFLANKKVFDAANKEFKTIMQQISIEFGKYDVIEEPKVFRIYRDVRFSSDKTPYKNNFAGYIERSTQMRRGGYYLHICPGESFIGGGFWQPEPHDLKRIRDEFAADPNTIQGIIQDPIFQKYFKKIEGESLVRPPKGYDAHLKAIDLIKQKGFVVTRPLPDNELKDPDFYKKAVDIYRSILPFHEYMSTVLTTNLNGELIV